MDPQELEAFVDPIFAEQMEELQIPGAVFVLVKDGEIVFAKGYGYADLESRTPVVPDKTLFRVGSVSKPFVATAIMQLVERGKINLHDNVNDYLTRFQLEDTYPQPVTLAHLLTHTAGLDDRFIALATRQLNPRETLGEYLAERMPPRIMPPGKFISYSTHGYALLGHVVEEVAGVSFSRYVEENICRPLDMTRTTFLPSRPMMSDLAVGYREEEGSLQPLPLDYVRAAPANQLMTTGTDIARFMIAHLQNGRYRDARILEQATVREMHRQQFTHHPRLPGWTYGFSEFYENNLRALEHGGAWGGFGSHLFLLPVHNLGIFFSYNKQIEIDFHRYLLSQFLDRYYPAQNQIASPERPPRSQYEYDRLVGKYRINLYGRRTLEKLRVFKFEPIRVTANDDGTLTIGAESKGFYKYAKIGPLLFQRVDDEGLVAFQEDSQGNITHLYMGPWAFGRLAWHETRLFHVVVVGAFMLVFLSAAAGWPAGSLVRRTRKKPGNPSSMFHTARLWAGLIGGLNLFFWISLAWVLSSFANEMIYGVPTVVKVLLLIGNLTSILALGLLVFLFLAWKNSYWSTLARLHYTLVCLSALAFVPYLAYWNLLGFRY